VSATQGGALQGNDVVWKLGNLGVNEGGVVSFTVNFGATGNYTNTAQLNYRVGLNKLKLASNTTQTLYGAGTDGGAGTGGAAGTDGGTAASGGAAGATSGGGGSSAAAGSGGSANGGSATGGSSGSSAAGGSTGDAGPGTGGKDGGASGSKSDSSGDSGGCGCRVPAPRGDSSAPLGALLALGLLLLRRAASSGDRAPRCAGPTRRSEP
jgi:MYXO-CTERM domain-containing protein